MSICTDACNAHARTHKHTRMHTHIHRSPCDVEVLGNTASEDLPLNAFYACWQVLLCCCCYMKNCNPTYQVHCKSLLWLSHLVPLFSLLLPTPFLILCAFYLWNNIGMHVVAVWMSGRVMCSCIPVWYHILCGSARQCSILSAWSANNAHPPCSRSRFTPGENAIQSEWL